ncbi:hypothetical protein RB598_009313 [Gaeumannomyces tritici]
MSTPGLVDRNRSGSSAARSRGRGTQPTEYAMPPRSAHTSTVMRYFEPSAATASMFLYAQGSSVVCCHHDTLTIERRFSRHSEEIQLLAVDVQSETGAGRLVVSYDAGQTAIVWDLMSGDEVARFASYEHLTTAAWMRNGNVAFGNTQGNIILFEPQTSEHISSRTLDQIAVTALAPSADCRTFAIGYQNGSLLIANLQPRFTILHNLTTSRGPSPIVSLSWHASSSRQKSDMLAVQTNDGDLRIWSVAKSYNNADPAKVVRILRKSENFLTGPNWMAWSKNGRIVQFSENETLSWDVRTKHVTFDSIPSLEHVRGLAVYGPGASLFTLGANNTVQQFDLNAPAVMVANVQHPANLLPPSPPVSIEEQEKAAAASASESEISVVIETTASESEEDHMSPLARMIKSKATPPPPPPPPPQQQQQQQQQQPNPQFRPASSQSSRSGVSDVSTTSSRTPGQYQGSIQSRTMTENTYISAGSSMRSSAVAAPRIRERDAYSVTGSLSSVSMAESSSGGRSRHRPSRLRNEVSQSPDDSRVDDLFKFTRSRLSDIPYKMPAMADASRLTNDDLRRQMLNTVFGWNGDVQGLIRDEASRHHNGSPNRILLSKWLGDVEPDIIATSSANMTSSDWMLLALSGIGGQASQHKLGRAYVQRLLESGDVHAAATIMIGMGDQNDAIEIYVSHRRFMEALLLACLFFPSVWERQAQILKKWGDWAVQHGQQQLAIRCLACIGKESSEPWTSPSAAQLTFGSLNSINGSIPEILSPPLSPPGINRGPQRSIAKTSALKLITTFGDTSAKSKYFAGDDGQTPIAAGITPIAESAISPGGYDPMTAILRPSQRSGFNTPSSARPTQGFGRQRLPSIGEAPGKRQPTPDIAVAEQRQLDARRHVRKSSAEVTNAQQAASIGRAATASPMMMRGKKEPPPPSPSPASMAMLMESGRTSRNGPRNRIPDGIDLHIQPTEVNGQSDVTSPEQSVASSTRFHWPTRRRGPGSVTSSVTSAASSVAKSQRARGYGHPGKTLDDYIHSLDTAGNRATSRGRARDSSRNRDQAGSREQSAERGRGASRGYTPRAGKRSPRSPVPMSPEDLINLSTPKHPEARMEHEGSILIDLNSSGPDQAPSAVRKTSSSQIRRSSKTRASGNSRHSSRGRRNTSAERLADRSRSRSLRDRSPTSPVPMSAVPGNFSGSEDEQDFRMALEAQERFRKNTTRGSSRGLREASPSSTSQKMRERTGSDHHLGGPSAKSSSPSYQQLYTLSGGHDDALASVRQLKNERQLKKEAAARELEERRKSLARRPTAPPIPHPDELSPIVSRAPTSFFDRALPNSGYVLPKDLPQRSATADPSSSRNAYTSTRPAIGLPATPKAMRLIHEPDAHGVPGVPQIPTTFAQRASPTASSPGKVSPKKEIPEPQLQPREYRQPSPKQHQPPPPPPPPQQQQQQQPQQKQQEVSLTLLPSTVYSPPVRPPIDRCMSAPPAEVLAPKTFGGGQISRGLSRQHSTRKMSQPDVMADVRQTVAIPTIDAMIGGGGRRPSHDSQVPLPPPPPPMLKELQHLAAPPPPPPAPLPFGGGPRPQVYGGTTSGMIEIVMDDDDQVPPPPPPPPSVPVASPLSESIVPILLPPAPPSAKGTSSSTSGHHRGRSSVDNSLASRFSRATERMRSASRNRTTNPSMVPRRSPESSTSPYESVPSGPPISFSNSRAAAVQHMEQQQIHIQNDYRTGLHRSEMI